MEQNFSVSLSGFHSVPRQSQKYIALVNATHTLVVALYQLWTLHIDMLLSYRCTSNVVLAPCVLEPIRTSLLSNHSHIKRGFFFDIRGHFLILFTPEESVWHGFAASTVLQAIHGPNRVVSCNIKFVDIPRLSTQGPYFIAPFLWLLHVDLQAVTALKWKDLLIHSPKLLRLCKSLKPVQILFIRGLTSRNHCPTIDFQM